MAPAAASGGSSLPSGFSVFTTFPDLLFILEFVFGGLVWILVASSRVPMPLVQGWVMFVSVFCFVATTVLLILYLIGAHGGESSWITLDAAYHCVAAMFYLSASVLEALATIGMQEGYTYKYYHENISAVVFSYVATLLITFGNTEMLSVVEKRRPKKARLCFSPCPPPNLPLVLFPCACISLLSSACISCVRSACSSDRDLAVDLMPVDGTFRGG
ncbi:Myelin and lymphocyte protein [Manis javanica]|nr:Myelin and lymphocyte protein [Manis javanica]